jgi:dTDP-glucose pyrophosphorylase
MEIIIPCAGLSTRFPNLRPKYLLTDYKGKLMVENAVENYVDKHNITIVILEKHDKDFGSVRKLKEAFGDKVKIVILEKPTSGPADTVYQGILKGNINLDSTILIKDCDSFFDAEEVGGNAICVTSLTSNPNVRNAAAKSYVVTNEQDIITTVVEKKIVSENFCVGGYQFNSAKEFVNAFESLKDSISKEIFVSEIIDYVISQGSVFVMNKVENFIDVGTSDDWFSFNNKPTYFCDIDGTILKSKFF